MSIQGAIIVACILFVTGIVLVLTKRNVLVMLIGVELMFNAANVVFVVSNQFWLEKGLDGMFMTLFVLAIVAAEMAIALAICLQAIKAFGTTNIDEMDSIKD